MKFWKSAAERAGKSAAQALLGLWALDGFNVLHADFPLAGGVAVGAAVLSLLTSIVSVGVGEPNSPSLVEIPSASARP
ncbi:holin [Micromonospora lupini]|uniref:holin n=1 Tax=Micromonospora lupini TaxID=285679 RepID=UPI00224E49A6|nr:holin [Micromonospora lupini]MCX5066888.1 holin [Micromonospora lupini]